MKNKETLEEYLQRLKDRRTEDNYKYTDEDFEKYKDYISDCCKSGMSVYKCLEFMYFAKIDMDNQLFNREPREEISYSEEEVIQLLQKALTHQDDGETGSLVTAQGKIRTANFFSWFNKFKKK